MSAHPLSDLLPIPEGVIKPNAYDVFGIPYELHDEQEIQSRIRKTISNLKSQKGSADPKRWKAAARLAADAKQLLNDPAQKERLSQQLTSMVGSPEAKSNAGKGAASLSQDRSPSHGDPLAGLLPTADPLQAFQPIIHDPHSTPPPIQTNPDPDDSRINNSQIPEERLEGLDSDVISPSENLLPPDTSLLPPETSLLPQELLAAMEADSDQASEQINTDPQVLPRFEDSVPSVKIQSKVAFKKPNSNRRRRSKTGMLVPAVFALCCFGMVGLALYFIINKPGVVVTMSDNGLAVNPADQMPPDEQDKPEVQPTPQKPKAPADPVMGKLGPTANENKTDQNDQKLTDPIPEGKDNPPTTVPEQNPTKAPMGMETKTPDATQPSETDPPPPPDLTKTPKPTMEALSPEVLEKAEQTLEAASNAIASANWDAMNEIANSMLDQEMSAEQKLQATELFQLIDLAIFYRTAIIDSITKLNAGDDFEVTNNFRVIVVEKSPEQLTIRYDRKNQSYTIDNLPWPLAHKLASFEVSDDSFSTAAKSVYQFIAPKTNDGLRKQAIEWISEIQPDLDETDKENIAATLQSLTEDKP